VSPAKAFYTLKTPTDLESVLSTSPRDVTMRLHRYIAEHAREFAQPAIYVTGEKSKIDPSPFWSRPHFGPQITNHKLAPKRP
jgi:hypothetical protein